MNKNDGVRRENGNDVKQKHFSKEFYVVRLIMKPIIMVHPAWKIDGNSYNYSLSCPSHNEAATG